MFKEERKAFIEKEVNFPYSKGKYIFYTNVCGSVFEKLYEIISKAKKFTVEHFIFFVSCLWIVNHMTNKLEGISSISSSVHDNCFCKARQDLKNCICKYCYAYNQQSYQTGLKEHNIINGLILRNILIPAKYFKALKILFPYLRIESFGDVQNVIQARNYIRIIKAFPEKRCAVWSKNIAIWEQAFKLEGKPKNTTYVHSSSYLNKPDQIDRKKYSFVDHVFTVYEKQYIKKHNIIINCGGRKCMECIMKKINCYYRNTEFYINEQKK